MKILLATYDLQPPWDSGHKVYGKGLLQSLQKITGADITTIRTFDNGISDIGDGYDFVHVILAGSQPLRKALKIFKKARVIKHILTPAINFKSSVSTKIYYALTDVIENRLIRCFSSDFVADSYFMNADLVIPPPIDTSVFCVSPKVDAATIMSMFENCTVKVGLNNIMRDGEGVILYSGPLTEDRFPYQQVLKSICNTRSKLLIIGRTANNGPGVEKVNEIIDFAGKLNIENRVAIALKSLNEDEKIRLINFSDVVIQPLAKSNHRFVAVDPPIFLLESMACGKPVITSKTYSLQQVIENGDNGYTIDWSNPTELDRALTDCLENRSIAKRARQTIMQDFSLELVTQKLRKIYDTYQ